jgi:hypothetical protein
MLNATLIREKGSAAERLIAFSPWSAAWAGALTATAIQICLTVLGAAVAASLTDPSTRPGNIATGAGAWWFVSGLLSLAAGGALTGYLHPCSSGCVRAINGFLAWGLVNLAGAFTALIGAGTTLAYLGGPLARIVPAYAGAADATLQPVTVEAAALWMTFVALLCGSLVTWMASWWVGGLFATARLSVDLRSVPRNVPPLPGAPLG